MSNGNIGEVILKLRKDKNITQDELGKILGVSNQAVSKWETGGSLPDIELLPSIADYYNISIDKLFGREISDYSDVDIEIVRHIQSFDSDKKLQAALEHCWVIERSLFSSDNTLNKENTLENINKNGLKYETYSQLLNDEGITFMRLNEDFQYFLLMPEAPGGFGNILNSDLEYQKFFSMLGEEDTFKCICLLYERENKPFTPKLFEKYFGIEKERAIEILERLKEYELIETSEIELDDEIQTVYNFIPNSIFVPFLAFAKELIKPPHHFKNNYDMRNKPYLRKK